MRSTSAARSDAREIRPAVAPSRKRMRPPTCAQRTRTVPARVPIRMRTVECAEQNAHSPKKCAHFGAPMKYAQNQRQVRAPAKEMSVREARRSMAGLSSWPLNPRRQNAPTRVRSAGCAQHQQVRQPEHAQGNCAQLRQMRLPDCAPQNTHRAPRNAHNRLRTAEDAPSTRASANVPSTSQQQMYLAPERGPQTKLFANQTEKKLAVPKS
jgi:hypothetical protein